MLSTRRSAVSFLQWRSTTLVTPCGQEMYMPPPTKPRKSPPRSAFEPRPERKNSREYITDRERDQSPPFIFHPGLSRSGLGSSLGCRGFDGLRPRLPGSGDQGG